MNAPPNIEPVAAGDVVRWLTNDTRDERFIDNIFAELCVRLQRAGIPVKRASLHILIHHPQWSQACRTGQTRGRARLRHEIHAPPHRIRKIEGDVRCRGNRTQRDQLAPRGSPVYGTRYPGYQEPAG